MVFLKQKLRLLKTNEHTIFRDQKDKWNGHKREANIFVFVSGILWLKPIMKLYLSITVELFLFIMQILVRFGYLIGSQPRFSNHVEWPALRNFSEKLTNWENLHNPNYYISIRNCQVIPKWFINLLSRARSQSSKLEIARGRLLVTALK